MGLLGKRSWVGFFAPARTPAAIIGRLNTEISQIVLLPDVKERLATQGMEPQPGAAGEFAAYVKKEVEKWSNIVKTVGLTVD
jgi:tripartite-type tricarboxylate transporter receptor subunit TctC